MTIPVTEEQEAADPWLRDQKGELGDGFVVIDGVTLPGVLAREIAVEYQENPKSEWPIRLTVSFYLDELTVAKNIAQFVNFTTALTGPRVEVTE